MVSTQQDSQTWHEFEDIIESWEEGEVSKFDASGQRLSYSSLSLFKQCPRKWQAKYIYNYPDTAGIEAELGKFVHNVLEVLYMYEPENRTIDAAKEIARQQWPQAYKDWLKAVDEHGHQDLHSEFQLKHMAWNSIASTLEMEDATSVDVIETEMELMCTIDGRNFLCKIDRVDRLEDGGVRIVDYKTGKFKEGKYLRDMSPQVILYAEAYNQNYGVLPSKAMLFYNNFGIIEFDINEDILFEFKKSIKLWNNKLNSALEVRSESFAPRTGPLCAYCNMIEYCPEGRKKFFELNHEGRVKAKAQAFDLLGVERISAWKTY